MKGFNDAFIVRKVNRNVVSSEIQHFLFILKTCDSILYIEKNKKKHFKSYQQ